MAPRAAPVAGPGWSAFFRDSDRQWVIKEKKGARWVSHRVPKQIQSEKDLRKYVVARHREVKRRAVASKTGKLVEHQARARLPVDITFRRFGELWTSGKLAGRFVDHVFPKSSAGTDESRLTNHIYPIIGDIPLIEFEGISGLTHVEQVMNALPLTNRNSRRQVAQVVNRLLNLAVFPVRLLERNPLPKGFIPIPRQRKAMSYVFPSEDRELMACEAVPLVERLYYGFMAREGSRPSEARLLQLQDVNFDQGLCYLDDTKTKHPREWPLAKGTLRALQLWRDHGLGSVPADSYVFPQEDGSPLCEYDRAANLREYLTKAGITRSQIFASDESRIPLRAHDLRASFVTVSLASGKTDTWVRDRTGHLSLKMMGLYNRWSRSHQEADLGDFDPLDQAIPELRRWAQGT